MTATRPQPSRVCIAVAVALTAFGCAKRLVLTYDPSTFVASPHRCANGPVGLLPFLDERDDITGKTFGTRVALASVTLPIAYESSLTTHVSISNYVTYAFREELRSRGCQVVDIGSPIGLGYKEARTQIRTVNSRGIDRIVVGRVRFFRWTQAGSPGFPGLADLVWPMLLAALPRGRLNVEVQLQIIDPDSGRILWAGVAGTVLETREMFPNRSEVERRISLGLRYSFEELFASDGFLAALQPNPAAADHSVAPGVSLP